MSILEKYVQEMKDRPFTMLLLCIVTLMTVRTASDYVPKTHHQNLRHHVYLQDVQITRQKYEDLLVEERAYLRAKQNQLKLLRFLDTHLASLPDRQVGTKQAEIEEDIAYHRTRILGLLAVRTAELDELQAKYENGQLDTMRMWDRL